MENGDVENLMILKDVQPQSANDYKEARFYVDTAEAFARTTHQCIYVLDIHRIGFLYVSENPLLLCGKRAKEVLKMGHDFYKEYIHPTDFKQIQKVHESALAFYDKLAVYDRLNYTLTYDCRIRQSNRQYALINHKLTPLALDKDHNIWLALCIVTHSSLPQPGKPYIVKKGSPKRFIYGLKKGVWETEKKIKLTTKEREILIFCSQGFTIDQIAEAFNIGASTVKFHKKNIFQKLQVKNIAQAVSCAINNRLLW